MPTIEKVTEGCLIGEGPHWDVAFQSLYFVDMFGKRILKYKPETKKVTEASFEKPVFHFIPVEGKKNEFLVALDNELTLISWDGERDKASIIKKLASVDPAMTFNDAKCDSLGRLWTGAHVVTLPDYEKTQPLGTLYSFDSNLHLKGHTDQIRCSNGLAFNDKAKKMYHVDSLERTIDKYGFDVISGTLTNRQTWFSLKKFDIPGLPDGMTIDSDGNLWVAIFGGGRVLKVSGDKNDTLLETLELPRKQVTSVAFGGQHFDELYVTTGAIDFDGMKPVPEIGNGEIYKVTGTGAKGLPPHNFRLN